MRLVSLMLFVVVGCACVEASEPPASSLQAGNVSLSTIDTKLDIIATKVDANTNALKGFAETLGNRNAEIEEVKGLIRTVQAGVDTVRDMVAEQANLKATPEKVEQRIIHIGDEAVDFNEFVDKWFVPGRWKLDPNAPLSHYECLIKHHGVPEKEVECLNSNEQSTLHAAIHTRDQELMQAAPPKAAKPAAAAPSAVAAAPSTQAYREVCENGVCRRVPVLQQQATTSRRAERKASRGK